MSILALFRVVNRYVGNLPPITGVCRMIRQANACRISINYFPQLGYPSSDRAQPYKFLLTTSA
jgi:hypothetical protein